MIIADTNVVSEFMKDAPEASVAVWAQGLAPEDLTISVVTVEEIDRGLGRLPHGRRRRDLERRWQTLLDAFSDTIATYDLPAARATARLVVDGMNAGRTMSLADAQIAGTCIAHAITLATRNVKDFAGVADLIVINPFNHPLS